MTSSLDELRRRVLDENESLSGLLRACLMLGADTHSQELVGWARRELQGYGDDEDVPSYRLLDNPPLYVNRIAGNMTVTGEEISKLQLPKDARDAVPDQLDFRQSIDEIERMESESKSLNVSRSGFAELAVFWSSQLGPFEAIRTIYYKIPPVVLSGMVGRIRTTLVDLIANLSSSVETDKLPTGHAVDSAVNVIVYGKKHKVSVTQGSPQAETSIDSPTSATPSDEGWWTWPRRIGAATAGLIAAIVGILTAVEKWPT